MTNSEAMGTTDSEIRRLTARQSAVYFFRPYFPFFLFLYMAGIGIAFRYSCAVCCLVCSYAAAAFLAVYGCYLLITCLQYQKNVLKAPGSIICVTLSKRQK